VKILFLGANGIDTSRLRIAAELREVQAEFERARARHEIELRVELAVTPVDLNRLLLDYEPDIVHFSGHGTLLREAPLRPSTTPDFERPGEGSPPEGAEQSAIVLETRDGKAAPVSVEALARLFGILKTQRCVVLNACFSAAQADAIGAHVDCVIGMKSAIDDESALVFAVGFYQAIARGQTVKAAFDLGRSLMSTCGCVYADVPELRGRADPGSVRLVGAGLPGAITNPLQVSDVQVTPNRKDGTCTLDFRVWNSGDADVLINRVELRVLEVRSGYSQGYFEFSKEYDLDIGALEKPGDVISCNVSQLIHPRGVDRFGVRLSATRLGAGEHRYWKLQTSLSTNVGSVEGQAVDLALPSENEESYVRRREDEARRLAWLNAVPSCLTRYSNEMQNSNIDLPAIRSALERAYPDPAIRSLILFEWFGAGDGSWTAASGYESVPELLLLELPTSVLVESLTTLALTFAHLQGATRYFAGGRFTAMKRGERSLLTTEIKEMFLKHSLAAGYDRARRFAVECAIGMPIPTSSRPSAQDILASNPWLLTEAHNAETQDILVSNPFLLTEAHNTETKAARLPALVELGPQRPDPAAIWLAEQASRGQDTTRRGRMWLIVGLLLALILSGAWYLWF
jgi:hypothetical protein